MILARITAADLRLGDNLSYEGVTGRVTSVERGPNVGVWLDGKDMRWLIAAGVELTVKRPT